MRSHAITVLVLMTAVSGALQAGEQSEPGETPDRINYSIGYQIGTDFKRQGVELNAEALLHGINDASAGSGAALGEEEMGAILRDLKGRIKSDQRVKAEERFELKKKEAQRKRDEGQAFLAHMAEQPGVKTLPSGLQYRVIKQGSGRQPGTQDTVTVHYRGALIDGHEFDSSYRRKAPSTFQVDGVIAGWTEALQLMHEGAEWEIFVPPELAYRRRGPLADQTLVFKIELLGVTASSQAQKNKPEQNKTP
jgi:FKBP-type peptidyl-prolyl cis-trans isomerase FklB